MERGKQRILPPIRVKGAPKRGVGREEARALAAKTSRTTWHTKPWNADPQNEKWKELQAATNARYGFDESKYNPWNPPAFEETISDKSMRCAYVRRKGEIKISEHWGQRKLLLSEIEFLTRFGEPNTTVVYAGSAPGCHLPLLFSMFPDLNWFLIDPAEFNADVHKAAAEYPGKIRVYQGLFTDELADELRRDSVRGLGLEQILSDIAELKACPFDMSEAIKRLEDTLFHLWTQRKKILFVCDVRSTGNERDEITAEAEMNMGMQARWHEIIRPARSMLKFRLPYVAGHEEGAEQPYPYLAGAIHTQAWAPQTSTETRLITDEWPLDAHHGTDVPMESCFLSEFPKMTYWPKEYEDAMFFLNRYQREHSFYLHPIVPYTAELPPRPVQLIEDRSKWEFSYQYDFLREAGILSEYLSTVTGLSFFTEVLKSRCPQYVWEDIPICETRPDYGCQKRSRSGIVMGCSACLARTCQRSRGLTLPLSPMQWEYVALLSLFISKVLGKNFAENRFRWYRSHNLDLDLYQRAEAKRRLSMIAGLDNFYKSMAAASIIG